MDILTGSSWRKFGALYVFPLIVWLGLSGCTLSNGSPEPGIDAQTLRPLLNSERIHRKFGSYGIELIKNGEKTRVSNLYSTHNNVKTTRTLAVVAYPQQVDAMFSQEHNRIIGGESIGLVFKGSGWQIEKLPYYFGTIPASSNLTQLYLIMGGIEPLNLALHVYALDVVKNGAKFRYAIISEIHHPDYLDLNLLEQIYSETFAQKQEVTEEISEILKKTKTELENL